MKILVCAGSFPTLINIKEAADVVSFSISKQLKSLNHQVDLQVINFENHINDKVASVTICGEIIITMVGGGRGAGRRRISNEVNLI